MSAPGCSCVVACKLHDQASAQLLQYVLRQVADRDSMLHLVVVIFQKSCRTEERREAQHLVRQQFGSLIPPGRPHRLHIVRLLSNGEETTDLGQASYIGRAICSKAAALESDVIVVGGKVRHAATGHVRNSPVAESVRKHSRRPVLLLSDDHPLLSQTLPVIAEGVEEQDDLSDEEVDSQDLPASPKLPLFMSPAGSTVLANQLMASITQVAGMPAADKAHLAPRASGKPGRSSLSVAAC